jgi:predicted enzyme related to lactoylglutathione lyase
MGFNGNGWFEIGTGDREATERFYADVFGWSYGDDESTADDGEPYRIVTTSGENGPGGGVRGLGGTRPDYSIFMIVVADTEQTCHAVEKAGGTVTVPATTTPDGLTWAHLTDPRGNLFGVFTPPPRG